VVVGEFQVVFRGFQFSLSQAVVVRALTPVVAVLAAAFHISRLSLSATPAR
jgi:hypothetical protein